MQKSSQTNSKSAKLKAPAAKKAKEIIVAKNIHKVYGKKSSEFQALQGLDFKLQRGESVAIIGKSGSGKSTLMHLLATLDAPTTGSIEIDGRDITGLGASQIDKIRNQKFGFVFQQFFLNPNDTVLENVATPLLIRGASKSERQELAREALEAVELLDKANNKAKDLSGGQKQRVCIARAIVTSPEVIFADEPTGNLDSNTGAQVEDLLFKLNKEKGITLIIVTHDEALAKRCSRRIQIKDGKIIKN